MEQRSLGGTRSVLRRWGEGPRRVVAVHCSLAHSGAWEGVTRHLPAGVRLEAFDIPGHGGAADWDRARDFTDQTLAMLSDLAGADELDLVGHSYGAVLCLIHALDNPARVRSLALFEPVLFAADRAGGADAQALFAPFERALGSGDTHAAARAFTAIWGAPVPWDQLPRHQRDALADRIHLIPAANPTLFDDRRGILRPGRLEALDLPVLLIEGSRSPGIVGAINGELARRLPDARREVIAGAGHMGPITHARAVAEALGRHLSLRPAGAAQPK